jgi:hypothetical protein
MEAQRHSIEEALLFVALERLINSAHCEGDLERANDLKKTLGSPQKSRVTN